MLSNYKFKTELHAHTSPVSGCSEIPAARIAEIYKNLGYDSIAITNHFIRFDSDKSKNDFLEYYINDFKIVEKCGKELGINVILGVEIRFTENVNDYLIYGVDENDLEEMYELIPYGIENFYKVFKNDKRVIIQAHPFRDVCSRAPANSIDGIESYNCHPSHNSRIAVSAKYAEENKYLVTCGTDFHHPGHEGLTGLLSENCIRDSFELAEVLKSRRYLFDIASSIVLPYGRNQKL